MHFTRRESLLSAAYGRQSLENSDAAENHLLELKQLDSGFFINQGGLELLADIYSREKRWEDIIALDSSTAGLPARFLLRLGEAFNASGNTSRAEELFLQVAEEKGSGVQAAAYGWLFSIYESVDRLEDMEQLILDAEAKLSGDRQALAGFWFRAGAVLSGGSSPARGLGYLKRAWDARKDLQLPATLPLFYARALSESGNIEEAVDILEQAQKESFGDPGQLAYNLAVLKAHQGDWKSTEGLLKPWENSLYAPASLLLAKAYMNLGLYTMGLQTAATAMERESSTRWQIELLNIIWQLQAVMGQYDSAVKSYAQMARLKGEDASVEDIKYARLLFNARLYNQVLRRTPEKTGSPETELLRGLSFIGLGNYAEARELLKALPVRSLSGEYRAMTGYYTAWCSYRLGEYKNALDGFSSFRRDFPQHPYAAEAVYFSGWAAFSIKQYTTAVDLFATYPANGLRAGEILFARAKALAASGNDGEALLLIDRYLETASGEENRGEALYLIFDIHLQNNDFTGAAKTLTRFEHENKSSPWFSRSLYRLGKAEFDAGYFEQSSVYLDRYRKDYPRGENAAEAIFYRGESAFKRGESRLALLLWDRLIHEYPDSRLLAEALSRRAGALTGLGEYRDALEAYSRLIAEYPAQASLLGAGDEVKRLETLLVSAGSEFKRLKTEAEKMGGAANAGGRILLIRAVQSAIAEGRAEEFEAAGEVVSRLIAANTANSAEQGKILFLAGEYQFRRNEYSLAASRYLQAAAADPSNRDFTAESLYRSAQMSLYAGDKRSYARVLERLRSGFPDSPWLDAAEKLEERL